MSKLTGRSRIELIDPDNARGRVGHLFADIRLKFGLVPNLFRVFANAPAALEGFVNLGSALLGGSLDEKTRQQLALAVAESNLCSYCLSAHRFIARRIGLTPAEIDDAIKARASDAKTDAILKLARGIVVTRGELTDDDLTRARAAGLTDSEIIETVANVALNIFQNYMSHVSRIPIDFPENGGGAISTDQSETDA